MRSSLLLQAPSGISSLPFGFVYWFCLFLNLHSPTVKKAELSSVWARCELLTYFGTRTCYVASATSFLKLLHRYTDSRPLDKIFSPLKITNLISSYQTIWTKQHSITTPVERQSHIDQLTRESGHWCLVLDLNAEPDHSGHVSCWSSQALLLPTPLLPQYWWQTTHLLPPMTWPMRSKRSGLGDNEEQEEQQQQVQIEWCSAGDRGGGCVWLVAAHRHYLLPSHLWPAAAAGGANHPPPPSHPLLRRLSLFAPVLGTFLRQPLRWRTDPINAWCFSKHVRTNIRVDKLD